LPLRLAEMAHLFTSDKPDQLSGIVKLELASKFINLLLLFHHTFFESAVSEHKLTFFVKRVNFTIFDPVKKTWILLKRYSFD
jgi:hypothetical protein